MSSMIVPMLVQLNGESEPQKHYALVFPDAISPEDLIPYRNAATTLVKAILTEKDPDFLFSDECFWLIQLAEFISSSLDVEYQKKGGHDV